MTFVGDKLRLARLAYGMTLEDLAQRVGATRQFLHQLESGAKFPTEEMELVLSEALDVMPEFFREPFRTAVRLEQCHFRKQLTTPASVKSQVLARGTFLDLIAAELDARLDLPVVDFPQCQTSDNEEIERTALHCRRHWGLGVDGPIVSMMRVVENAGAVVTHFSGISDRIDALSMDRRRPIIVRSAAKESLCRLRFDLAHECGHLVMHKGVETGDRVTEGQADRFASAFLLPRAAFFAEFPRGKTLNWKVMIDLKRRWKVSLRAILRRAFDLEIISAAQYRTGNIHLVKSGQAKVERLDAELPLETEELQAAAFRTLEASNPNSIQELASKIGIGPKLFELLTGRKLPESVPAVLGENVVRLASAKRQFVRA